MSNQKTKPTAGPMVSADRIKVALALHEKIEATLSAVYDLVPDTPYADDVKDWIGVAAERAALATLDLKNDLGRLERAATNQGQNPMLASYRRGAARSH